MTAQAPARARQQLPARSELDPRDCWDLSSLYTDEADWEADFRRVQALAEQLAGWRGRLAEGAAALRSYLDLQTEAHRLLDRLRNYAGRRSDEDTTDGHYRGLLQRVSALAAELGEKTSFFLPELLALPPAQMQQLLGAEQLAPYRFYLERQLRWREHTLTAGEERLLAMASELARVPYEAFGQLHHADLRFGFIVDEDGREVEVSHASYSAFLARPDRELRRRFFQQYYRAFQEHRHTLAATLAGAIKRDLFYARARRFASAREAALFAAHVPVAVYDALLEAVHRRLPVLHRYYELRRRALGLEELRFYDLMVPLVPELRVHLTYEEAVDLVCAALAPLGEQYVSTLRQGLLGGWVDRYENRGKRAGAYAAGAYDSTPLILLNYRGESLEDVYTLAHEAGHAMHTWYSNRHQPPQYADYGIFVAEVASTFNEELLTAHLLRIWDDPRRRAYVVHRAIDDFRATFFRQAMFAEFEHLVHQRAERGEPLSLQDFQRLYHELLERHHGPGLTLDPELDLECLRIPHFYYNFYVYQYATGMAAAVVLAQRLLAGEPGARERYLALLAAGGSDEPIPLLQRAGADMTSPEPIETALAHFERLVEQLEPMLAALQ
ncbi:MAG: peptidase [Planctomycetota bacterium]|nr:MAG: peptidase [Planctomycetota bacterium]